LGKALLNSPETETGGKEWKFAEVTWPPCQTYLEKALLSAESRGKREQAAANRTVTLPTRWGSGGKVAVEGSSKCGKLCQ